MCSYPNNRSIPYVERLLQPQASSHTCVTLALLPQPNPTETSTMMKTVCLAALAGSAVAFAPAQVVSALNIVWLEYIRVQVDLTP